MPVVVLSIGSNVGDRLAALQSVVDAMTTDFVAIEASGVFETAPWGGVEQPSFLNAGIRAITQLAPMEVLAFAQQCEHAAGRSRDVRWGPRTLDVDVITYDDMRSDEPVLTLPHPHAHERRFVLACLCDIDPDMELPGRGSVRDLLALLPDDGDVVRTPFGLVMP